MKGYRGQPFNVIHCDFPYGIGVGKGPGQSGAYAKGEYEDTADVYFELLDVFLTNQERFVISKAHLIFWFSMNYYTETLEALQQAGWQVNTHPLIWYKSDKRGIMPDTARENRRVYETAFLASLGDRKLTKPSINLSAWPSIKHKDAHPSAKNQLMLLDFFSPIVDKHVRFLDPTCGGGTSLTAALTCWANYALGIELEPVFAGKSSKRLEDFMKSRDKMGLKLEEDEKQARRGLDE